VKTGEKRGHWGLHSDSWKLGAEKGKAWSRKGPRVESGLKGRKKPFKQILGRAAIDKEIREKIREEPTHKVG